MHGLPKVLHTFTSPDMRLKFHLMTFMHHTVQVVRYVPSVHYCEAAVRCLLTGLMLRAVACYSSSCVDRSNLTAFSIHAAAYALRLLWNFHDLSCFSVVFMLHNFRLYWTCSLVSSISLVVPQLVWGVARSDVDHVCLNFISMRTCWKLGCNASHLVWCSCIAHLDCWISHHGL